MKIALSDFLISLLSKKLLLKSACNFPSMFHSICAPFSSAAQVDEVNFSSQ